jgi:hypothetical protein
MSDEQQFLDNPDPKIDAVLVKVYQHLIELAERAEAEEGKEKEQGHTEGPATPMQSAGG